MPAVRLMVSGVFDRHPKLKVILARCGAGLPSYVSRLEPRLRPLLSTYSRPLRTYLENNFWVTTAGFMSDKTLADTVQIFGAARVMWGADVGSYATYGHWFDHLDMDEHPMDRIGFDNAQRLLKF